MPPHEAELRADLHRQVFEKNLAVQLLIDPATGRIVEANPAACRFYGYTHDQLLGLRITDINTLPPAEVAEAMRDASGERRNAFSFQHRLASGDVRDVEVHSGPVEVGGRVLLYSIIHDVTERRRAEQAVARGESNFRVLFAAHPHPMWVYDLADLRFLEVNQAAVHRYGWSREEFLAMKITDIRPPEDVPRLLESLETADRTVPRLWRHRLRDGQIIDVEVLCHPLAFADRQAALVVAEDVTERRRTEIALRQSEEKYRLILDSIDEGYYEVDLKGNLTFFNDAYCRALGYTREELMGRNYRQIMDDPNARRAFQHFNEIYQTGKGARLADFQIRHKDGSARTAEASVAPIVDTQGQTQGFRGVLVDVTESHQAAAALRESEERYRRLVELSPDGFAIHRQGTVVFVNQAGAEMLGADSPEQIVGRPVLDFVHESNRARVAARMQALARGEPAPLMEERFQRLDGGTLDVEVAAMPFLYQGEPAVQVVVRDITAHKRAEKLQAALYRIAQMASSVVDMNAFYASIHGVVGELMYARNFYIATRDPVTGTIHFDYFVDEEDEQPPEIKPGKSLTEYVLRTGEPLLASPAVHSELERRGEIELLGAASLDWLGVPLKRGDNEVFGVLVVQSYSESRRFSVTDRDLLTFVSQHVAGAIDRKRASDALRESETRFRTLAETAPCAIVIYQGAGFRYANPAMTAVCGYSREELLTMSFWDIVHPDSQELVRSRGLARQQSLEVPSEYEFKIVRKDGGERWMDFSAGLIEIDGQPAALGTGFDITERKVAEEQIKNLAYHDVLTGLPNRLLFIDRLEMAVAQAHRQGHRVAVVFLDVDRFKVINDSLGHSLGDRVLQLVADRVQACVREGDTVARLGGDEFTLLLPGLARAVDVAKVAEKILDTVRAPFVLDGRELFVTVSMGIGLYPDDGVDGEALVKNADAAMYRAKEQGRDNYQLYTPAMNATAIERLALESSLRRALDHGELEVYYQPLLDLGARRVHGTEALLRWRHPERGLVGPSEFIPLAEVTGLILPIGEWVLRTACAQTRAFQLRGHPNLSVAVNLSTRQFSQPDLVDQVRRALEATGLAARCLELEITESNAMQNAEATIHTLRELNDLGVCISIDDFGIGYSSLNYLKRLPIDTLKIDQSFVRDITTDPDDAAIATAVIALAHTLRLRVVAEGVENQEQLSFLTAHHCDRMQGFFFSHPLTAEECTSFLDRSSRS